VCGVTVTTIQIRWIGHDPMSDPVRTVRRAVSQTDKETLMPTYCALIWEGKQALRDPSAPDFASYMAGYGEFGAAAGEAIVGGAALLGDDTATTVRVTGGKGGDVVLHDGPGVEVKEMLGGFYLLDAADLDAAVALAAQIPAAWDGGCVEVRPTMSM
jgi:hypothetical protein